MLKINNKKENLTKKPIPVNKIYPSSQGFYNDMKYSTTGEHSFINIIKEGFSFGLGSSIARGVFNSFNHKIEDSHNENHTIISYPEEVASGNVHLPDKKKYSAEELFNMYIECINNANGNINEIHACSKILE